MTVVHPNDIRRLRKILYYLKWLGCRRNPWNDHMCSCVSKRKRMCSFVIKWKKTGHTHTPQICIRIRARNRGFLPLLFSLSKSLNDSGASQWHSSFGKILYYLKRLGCRRNLWNDHMCSFVSKRKRMCSFVRKWFFFKTDTHIKKCIRIRGRNRSLLPLLWVLS